MDVLNSRTIPLSFPKEVKNSLRTSVQSAIESVCYMFVVQASRCTACLRCAVPKQGVVWWERSRLFPPVWALPREVRVRNIQV